MSRHELRRVILTLPSGRDEDCNNVSRNGKGDESVSKTGRIDQAHIDHWYDNEGNETDGLWKRDVLEPYDLPKRYFGHAAGLTFEEKKASLRPSFGKKTLSAARICCCDSHRFKLCQERIANAHLCPPGMHPANMICGYNPGEFEDFIKGGFTLWATQ